MNGVCCRRLLDEVDVVFGKIIKLVIAKVEGDVEKDNAEIHKLTEVVYTFKSLFECMDMVFSKLRILAPTDDEIEEMTIAIKALESMWHELDLSVTPKMHILITHTIAQVICFGGIADKVEDFVEKSHQVGKKMDHLVARMRSQCFRQQELVKIRRQWLSNDPSVSKRIASVQQSKKRKNRSHVPSLNMKKSKAETKVEVKLEKRNTILRKMIGKMNNE